MSDAHTWLIIGAAKPSFTIYWGGQCVRRPCFTIALQIIGAARAAPDAHAPYQIYTTMWPESDLVTQPVISIYDSNKEKVCSLESHE